MKNGFLIAPCFLTTSRFARGAFAQNFSISGPVWSRGWSFGTANDRSNYVDVIADNCAVTTDFQDGNNIRENTYAVGALNTGSTTITLEGDDNTVEAVNTADTVGFTDASILNVVLDGLSGIPSSACD